MGAVEDSADMIAGDTTRNLLWRLQNGEGPGSLSPKVAIVLIGTNDITNPVYNLVLVPISNCFVAVA